MRLSRPCYDKFHRCPGWAGGGLRYARVDRCDDGRLRRDGTLEGLYVGRCWRLRFNRCDTCDVLVLPYVVRYVDPRWLRYAVACAWEELCYRIDEWYERGRDDRR